MRGKQRSTMTPDAVGEFTTDVAAAKLGISPSQFRRIVMVREYEPSRIEEWHHGRRQGTWHFWSRRTIATIRRTNEYARLIERRLAKRLKFDEWVHEQERREHAQEALLGEVHQLPLDEHLRLALECLHAANRAAKHASHVNWRLTIYGAKDAFLSVMIRASLASVETFQVKQAGRRQFCTRCGHEWVGDEHCYSCDEDSGVSAPELRRWYLVDCGSGYRFHQPSLSADLAGRAISIEPHDPTQEPRTIPTVRLSRERTLDLTAQVNIVMAAAKRLTASPGPARSITGVREDAEGVPRSGSGRRSETAFP